MKRVACIALVVAAAFGCGRQDPEAAGPAFAGAPGEGVQWKEYRPTNSRANAKWGVVLKSIVNHEAPGDSNSYDDLITLGHETSHGIHAHIRNALNDSGRRANGFYALGDRAALVEEPAMRKSHVAPFVPASLRGPRYATYITGQTDWDDTPLYVWDEWNAYVNGGDAGVDQVERGLWTAGWRDGVAGQLEFNVYALAVAMAAQQRDPAYFRDNAQFREFLAWNLRRSMTSYRKGAVMEQFKWDQQDRYYEAMRTAADAEALRRFTRELFGAAWAAEVMGF